jgi:CRISPR system Cascade subunit CasD
MQSWGTDSRFSVRDTRREPSKSGIIGLLAAALGMGRDDDHGLARLAVLRLGVRVDRVGQVAQDYHTAGGGKVAGLKYGVIKADGKSVGTVVSTRYYLGDAEFVVGLEGDQALLRELDRALAAPVFPLYAGRRSFVPTPPLRLGIVDQDLRGALAGWGWVPRDGRDEIPDSGLRLLLETDDPHDEARYDYPLSFRSDGRRYRLRYVRKDWVPQAEVHKEVAHVPLPVSA